MKVPIICAAGHRGMVEGKDLATLSRCKCGNTDLDLDDGLPDRAAGKGVIAVEAGDIDARFAAWMGVDLPMKELKDKDEVKEAVRCSTCFHEFVSKAPDSAARLPVCPNCGADTLTAAGTSTVVRSASRKQASTPPDVFDHIMARDPDGGNVYPTPEMYARFEQWVRSTYGDQAWRDYKGWGNEEDSNYAPWAEDDIPDAAFHASSKPQFHDTPSGRRMEARLRKVAEISQGILATNPGMSREAAVAIARKTIERYPKVAGSRNQ